MELMKQVKDLKKEQKVIPSLVQVYFPGRHLKLSYYNDAFNLSCGDIVYVEGKMEGLRGRVVSVNYNFKIKLSDYKRVTSVAETDIAGEFYMAGSHFLTFDSISLPAEKVKTWFKAPEEPEEFAIGRDDSGFLLDEILGQPISEEALEEARVLFLQNQVVYLTLDQGKGYAIVQDGDVYEVEFDYRDGRISYLVCSCFCGEICEHQVSVLFQLQELLRMIDREYGVLYEATGYFGAVAKNEFFSFVLDGKKSGKFSLTERSFS